MNARRLQPGSRTPASKHREQSFVLVSLMMLCLLLVVGPRWMTPTHARQMHARENPGADLYDPDADDVLNAGLIGDRDGLADSGTTTMATERHADEYEDEDEYSSEDNLAQQIPEQVLSKLGKGWRLEADGTVTFDPNGLHGPHNPSHAEYDEGGDLSGSSDAISREAAGAEEGDFTDKHKQSLYTEEANQVVNGDFNDDENIFDPAPFVELQNEEFMAAAAADRKLREAEEAVAASRGMAAAPVEPDVLVRCVAQAKGPRGSRIFHAKNQEQLVRLLAECTHVIGGVRIGPSNGQPDDETITDLSALASLQVIEGFLDIQNLAALTDDRGLGHLRHVGGYLRISRVNKLESLSGLTALRDIGDNLPGYLWSGNRFSLMVQDNALLANLDSLRKLGFVRDGIIISDNPRLLSIEGLQGITTTAGPIHIENNAVLRGIKSAFTHVLEISGYLRLWKNPAMTTLDGLGSLRTIVGTGLWEKSWALMLHHLNGVTSLEPLKKSLVRIGAGGVFAFANAKFCPQDIPWRSITADPKASLYFELNAPDCPNYASKLCVCS
ncbi:hypothetical protein CAOG_01112 [Capsaspora owczarzaki ATCC 30864]|uniref:hypothetical protein n=1 Tax=Capsaspora owczarzaki (strain ATCC 30864) TaxID=595528 RepID=UPI0001FE2582|nr:hypothetical protein CAOG_01112 [Capsaspora owczarzaki ATCC 30864]|eukprot:XP_004365983.1 hypothetical protein CAOG_01112 [Capsaspora owczarzaki ATCC 30864]